MYLEIAAVAFLAGQWAYHRWFEDKPPRQRKLLEVSIPRVEAGAPVPLSIGRCRVRAPILAWHSRPYREVGDPFGNGYPADQFVYFMNMFFVLGIGMDDGNGDNALHRIWGGEKRFSNLGPFTPGDDITTQLDTSAGVDFGPIGSLATFYDGNPLQDPAAETLGLIMTDDGVDVFQIPAFVGYHSVLLFANSPSAWISGSRPNLPQYSFEVSSYHTSHPQLSTYARVGDDSNPVNAIYDLLVSKFGKLGLSSSLIDITSFQDAQYTLHTETHGYSRVIEDVTDADTIIGEILRQIDGVLYFDEAAQTIKIKLIRPDYNPSDLTVVNKHNAVKLVGFTMSSKSNIINKLRINFTNRGSEDPTSEDYRADYADGVEIARNQANAVGQGGEVNEQVLDMPGICTRELARAIAARELGARSRPIIKFRIIGGRSLLSLNPGDPIVVQWGNPDVNGIFRIANVERGSLEDGAIALDCVSESFLVYRGRTPIAPDFGSSGGGGITAG